MMPCTRDLILSFQGSVKWSSLITSTILIYFRVLKLWHHGETGNLFPESLGHSRSVLRLTVNCCVSLICWVTEKIPVLVKRVLLKSSGGKGTQRTSNADYQFVPLVYVFTSKKKNFFFFFFGHAACHLGSQFPDLGSSHSLLHPKCRVLTPGPPEKSSVYIFKWAVTVEENCRASLYSEYIHKERVCRQ